MSNVQYVAFGKAARAPEPDPLDDEFIRLYEIERHTALLRQTMRDLKHYTGPLGLIFIVWQLLAEQAANV
jgi:hypothetical protein